MVVASVTDNDYPGISISRGWCCLSRITDPLVQCKYHLVPSVYPRKECGVVDALGELCTQKAKGNIREFTNTDINVDRLELVRFHPVSLAESPLTITRWWKLRGVTKGLIYMHNQRVIHGDLKGVRFRKMLPLPCTYY